MTLQFFPLLVQALALLMAVSLPVALFALWWRRRFTATQKEVSRVGEAAFQLHQVVFTAFYDASKPPLNNTEMEILLVHRLPVALEQLEIALYGKAVKRTLVRRQPENFHATSQPQPPAER